MNNSVTIAYRFKITLQLCFFDGSKPRNNDELQPRLSNFFKNFDSNGGDDLCYQGGLDQTPLESTQSEFVCSSYGQNSGQVSGDHSALVISSFKLQFFVRYQAPTPNSTIIQLDVDDNFVINSTHLNMIRENKFNGYLRADPHDHIREFLAICDMFKYGETQSEAVKLLIFPFSLCDEAKTWFNELNEESITSWEQMRRAFINRFFPPSLFNRLLLKIRNFSQLVCESLTDAWLRLKSMVRKCHGHGLTKGAIIQIFYYGLDEPTQGILDITAGGIFLYKSPNQAFQFLEDKVLFEHDWPIKSKNEHHQKSVSFADGSDSNTDNSRFMEKLKAMDSQIISLNEELQDIRNKYNDLREGNTSKTHLNDDTPMCEHHEANYIQSEDYQNQDSHNSFSCQFHYDPNDSEKLLT
ncbi:reverse transcriptase domain-containing protein [Tanacetum coccineum]|uniref:Reverse transcriptase domain-containing protein n=1 Tax=Tanacetum coccineum TaxID=301880 RepID=A0ABQ5BTX3_9ASTR